MSVTIEPFSRTAVAPMRKCGEVLRDERAYVSAWRGMVVVGTERDCSFESEVFMALEELDKGRMHMTLKERFDSAAAVRIARTTLL